MVLIVEGEIYKDIKNEYQKYHLNTNFWLKYLSWNKRTQVYIGNFYNENKNLFDWSLVSNKDNVLDIDKLSKWSIVTSHKYAELIF